MPLEDGGGGHPFLRMYLWWRVCALYLLACPMELPSLIQVSVVVSLVSFSLLTPLFVDFSREPVWPSGQVARPVRRLIQVRSHFDSQASSKVMV